MKPILFTGIRPTGDLHIGHYFSLIKPIIDLQKDRKIFIMFADLHARTELRKVAHFMTPRKYQDKINENIKDAMNILARFFDLNDFVIFRQSDLMHLHLNLFYNLLMLSKNNHVFGNPVFMETMKNETTEVIKSMKLEKLWVELLTDFFEFHPELYYTSFDDSLKMELFMFLKNRGCKIKMESVNKIVKLLNTRSGSIGFATYPILMAADIILYRPDEVLVGHDQLPHIHITNDLIRIMNNMVEDGKIKPVKGLVVAAQTVRGNDGRKMSKTYGNYLSLKSLLDSSETFRKWVNKLVTIPRMMGESADASNCLVGEFAQLFSIDRIFSLCKEGAISCSTCKDLLYNKVYLIMRGCSKNNNESHLTMDEIEDILEEGRDTAMERIVDSSLFDRWI